MSIVDFETQNLVNPSSVEAVQYTRPASSISTWLKLMLDIAEPPLVCTFQTMLEEDLEVLKWAGCSHGGFLLLLLLCLTLHYCPCWPSLHSKSVTLSVEKKKKIEDIINIWKGDLKTAVKKVIVARLNDGKPITDKLSLTIAIPRLQKKAFHNMG